MSITLLTATTVNHALTEFSLKKSLQALKFDKVVVAVAILSINVSVIVNVDALILAM